MLQSVDGENADGGKNDGVFGDDIEIVDEITGSPPTKLKVKEEEEEEVVVQNESEQRKK